MKDQNKRIQDSLVYCFLLLFKGAQAFPASMRYQRSSHLRKIWTKSYYLPVILTGTESSKTVNTSTISNDKLSSEHHTYHLRGNIAIIAYILKHIERTVKPPRQGGLKLINSIHDKR